jgi:hypothetical protein
VKKKFAKTEKDIAKLIGEIEQAETRKSEAIDLVTQGEQNTSELENQLRIILVEGDQKLVAKVEEQIESLRLKSIRRPRLLIDGLKDEILKLNEQLNEARERRTELFGQLATTWLAGERSAYDGLAKQLLEKLKRLLVCHNLMRDEDVGKIYPEIIGPGYGVLSHLKIPVLQNFKIAEFNSRGQLHSGRDSYDKVFAEITQK